jgi:hypothetical protein
MEKVIIQLKEIEKEHSEFFNKTGRTITECYSTTIFHSTKNSFSNRKIGRENK